MPTSPSDNGEAIGVVSQPSTQPAAEAVKPTPVVKTSRHDGKKMPVWVFVVVLLWLVGLIGLGIAYATSSDVRAAFPKALWGLPLAVPWFGAVGATLASLAAIGDHAAHWSSGTEYRHVARPLTGAVMGVVGALILFLITDLAAGGTGGKISVAAYDVVAFIAGYREETFRLLVKRATDALFIPGDKKTQPELKP